MINIEDTADPTGPPTTGLAHDLAAVMNRHSQENRSGTPDFMLAAYLIGCLRVWEDVTGDRDQWWGLAPRKLRDVLLPEDEPT
jgi:hypothetical protein